MDAASPPVISVEWGQKKPQTYLKRRENPPIEDPGPYLADQSEGALL